MMSKKDLIRYKVAQNRVRLLISRLEGVECATIIERDQFDMEWHLSKMHKVWALDIVTDPDEISFRQQLAHPVTIQQVCDLVLSAALLEKGDKCLWQHEGIIIQAVLDEPEQFLKFLFKTHHCYDIQCVLLDPERTIIVNDNEYNVELFIFDRNQHSDRLYKE